MEGEEHGTIDRFWRFGDMPSRAEDVGEAPETGHRISRCGCRG
jgi:hypothetical protein